MRKFENLLFELLVLNCRRLKFSLALAAILHHLLRQVFIYFFDGTINKVKMKGDLLGLLRWPK